MAFSCWGVGVMPSIEATDGGIVVGSGGWRGGVNKVLS